MRALIDIILSSYSRLSANTLRLMRKLAERRRDKEAMLRSRQEAQAIDRHFSQLIQNSFDTIVILDAEGIQRYVSPSAERCHGYAPSELVDIPVIERMIHPDDQERVLSAFRQIIETGSGGVQYRHRCKSGGWVHLEARGSNQLGNPDIGGVVVNVRDITERTQTEAVLRNKSDFLTKLVETATEGVSVCQACEAFPFVRFALWNNRMTEITGYTMEEINRLGWYQAMYPDPDVQASAVARMERMRDGDNLKGEEWQITTKEGKKRMLAISTSVMFLEDGSPAVVGLMQDMTERMQAEAALAESEKKYRVLVETTDTGYLILDHQGRVLDANAEYVRLTGHGKLGEILGRNVMEWTAPHEKQKNAEALTRCVRNRGIRNLEIDYLWPDGRIVPIDINATVQGEGEAMQIISLCRDISERRQVEEVLRESEERYRLISENMIDLICVHAPDSKFLYVSPSVETMLGFVPADLLGRNPSEFFHPEDAALLFEPFYNQVAIAGQDDHLTYRFRNRDGAYVWLETLVKPLMNEAGKVVRIQSVSRNVTARLMAEQALRNAKEKYDQLASRVPIGLCKFRIRANGSMGFDYVSARFCEILMLEEVTILKDEGAAFALVHPNDVSDLMESVRVAGLTLPERFQWEGRFVIDGRIRWMRLESTPTVQPNGDSVWDAVMIDMTERKEMEEALNLAKEIAEAATRAKSDFLAAMSHEIRTPMNVVLGMSDVLLETNLDPEQRQIVQTMHRSGKALMGVINDVLDFSRIESGCFTVSDLPFSPRQVVEEIVCLMRMTAESKGLALTEEISQDIPDVVLGDDGRIRQVLINLLGNAIKFTPQGQVSVRLSPHPRESESLLFSVADTGIGIAQEHANRIFEHFTQADSGITRRFGGAGLGLAISQKLVGLMGGRIWVESQLGEGSTFFFTLPSRAVTATAQRVAPSKTANAATHRSLHILVAEDAPENQMLIHAYLKRTPHHVVIVNDGIEAVARVREESFDLLLMDVQMPNMDGYSAARAIRQWEQGTGRQPLTIMALTAHVGIEKQGESLAAGCDGHLTKPIKKQTLLDAIQRVAESISKRELLDAVWHVPQEDSSDS